MGEQDQPKQLFNTQLNVAVFYCLAAQVLALLPLRTASFVPWAGRKSIDLKHSILLLIIFPLFFSLCSVLLLVISSRRRVLRTAAILVLFGVNLMSIGAAQYHLRFGAYPGGALLRIARDSPRVLIGYTSSGVYLFDILTLLVVGSLVLFCILRASRTISNSAYQWKSLRLYVVCVTAGAVFLAVSLYVMPSRPALVEHTFPWLKWAGDVADASTGRSVLRVANYLPRQQSRTGEPVRPPAQHVVIIVAECFRPDHLAWNGYPVDTMPLLNKDSPAWIRFPDARANATTTEESFPILLNNRYLAGVLRDPQGSRDLWRELRMTGVKSGFFSAGAMEWAGLTSLLSLEEVGSVYTASTPGNARTHPFTTLAFDYGVPDYDAVEHWKHFVAEAAAAGERTFSMVHLVGSHYPFITAAPEFQLPDDSSSKGTGPRQSVLSYEAHISMPSDELERMKRRYDRALGSVDRSISEIVEQLERVGQLQQSVVILTGDHGESFGERGYLFHGTNLFNEQLRVPIDFRVGQNLQSIRSSLEEAAHTPIASSIDLVPTALDMLALPIPNDFEGYSLLRSDRKPYEVAIAAGLAQMFAVWNGRGQHVYDLTTGEYWKMSLQGEEVPPTLEYNGIERFLDSMETRGILRSRQR